MKLSFVTAILPELSLTQVFAHARDLGYDEVELMCWPVGRAERRYAGVTHLDVSDFDPAEVRALSADHGVGISGLGYYPNPLSADPDEARTAREHLGRVIEAAAALGVGVVNTFVGRDPRKSVEENWPRVMEVWPDLVARAEQAGVRIGIENCPMLFTGDEWPGGKNLATSPRIWRRLFEAIPSPAFGLNYDPSHLVWQGMDRVAPLREFGPRLVHVHAKDARVDRDALDDVGHLAVPLDYHSPVLPGRGDVNWPAFFATLSATGYDGSIAVEVEDRAYEGSLHDRLRALRESAAFLRPFLNPHA